MTGNPDPIDRPFPARNGEPYPDPTDGPTDLAEAAAKLRATLEAADLRREAVAAAHLRELLARRPIRIELSTLIRFASTGAGGSSTGVGATVYERRIDGRWVTRRGLPVLLPSGDDPQDAAQLLRDLADLCESE